MKNIVKLFVISTLAVVISTSCGTGTDDIDNNAENHQVIENADYNTNGINSEVDNDIISEETQNNNVSKYVVELTNSENDENATFVGVAEIDDQSRDVIYGEWKVAEFLAYPIHYTDGAEGGEDVIGSTIIIKDDLFSTVNLTNYPEFQYELKNPIYSIKSICYNSEEFYKFYKIDTEDLKLNYSDDFIEIEATTENVKMTTVRVCVVNNNRVLLSLGGGGVFELEKK